MLLRTYGCKRSSLRNKNRISNPKFASDSNLVHCVFYKHSAPLFISCAISCPFFFTYNAVRGKGSHFNVSCFFFESLQFIVICIINEFISGGKSHTHTLARSLALSQPNAELSINQNMRTQKRTAFTFLSLV